MASGASQLPLERLVCTAEEDTQDVLPAQQTLLTHEKSRPNVSADELATLSEGAMGSERGEEPSSTIISLAFEAYTETEGLNETSLPGACTHPISLETPDQTSLALHDSATRLPSIISPRTRCKTVSKEMDDLYLDDDAIPIMSSILRQGVKYHEETADFRDGDCLVTVIKGLGAIMKPPEELTGYFDIANRKWVVKEALKKEQASRESLQAMSLWKETFRYDYVKKLAEANVRSYYGEIEAVKELTDVVSKGRSEENYRKHHQFWKLLRDLRVEGMINVEDDTTARMLKEGLMQILLFRTTGFDRRFFNETKDPLQTVRKWNQVYYPYMKEVRMRALSKRFDDFSGRIDLCQVVVRKALKVAPVNWIYGTRTLDREELQSYLASFDRTLRPEELSSQSATEVLRDGINGESERNNAIYICLVPYEGPPNRKRKPDGSPASRMVVAPCPVVPILPGDFLGIMSGQLRYTSEVDRSDKSIPGSYPNLCLDFSKVTGKLSSMKSATSDHEANVALTWKRYNKHVVDWRVEVVATKEIWPFEELVRPNACSREAS